MRRVMAIVGGVAALVLVSCGRGSSVVKTTETKKIDATPQQQQDTQEDQDLAFRTMPKQFHGKQEVNPNQGR